LLFGNNQTATNVQSAARPEYGVSYSATVLKSKPGFGRYIISATNIAGVFMRDFVLTAAEQPQSASYVLANNVSPPREYLRRYHRSELSDQRLARD